MTILKRDKILVTGCAGFIGYHFTQKLLKKGFVVVEVDNLNNYYSTKLKYDRLNLLKKNSRFVFSKTDIA